MIMYKSVVKKMTLPDKDFRITTGPIYEHDTSIKWLYILWLYNSELALQVMQAIYSIIVDPLSLIPDDIWKFTYKNKLSMLNVHIWCIKANVKIYEKKTKSRINIHEVSLNTVTIIQYSFWFKT